MELNQISQSLQLDFSTRTKSSEYLYSATISDVHLGHPRTPTRLIVDNLNHDLLSDPDLAKVDILWISGDLFDRLITVPDPNNFEIIRFIGKLLYICELHDIALRVLEGTGSHDYRQSKLIQEILNSSKRKVDYKYFDQLTIDYDERFGLYVLYVPDEVNTDSSVTWHQVQKLLNEKGIDKVDYAIMHGFFEFQLPEHVHNPSAHLSTRYKSIVRRYILIGHHHTHRIEGPIIVPGSFDRLAHNEEHLKGHVRIKDYGSRGEIKFIPNRRAKIYESIKLFGKTLEESLQQIDAKVADKPRGSAFMVKADSVDPIAKSMDLVKSRHPDFIWSSAFEREDTKTARIEEIQLAYNPIVITKENLPGLLEERLSSKAEPATVILALELLGGLL